MAIVRRCTITRSPVFSPTVEFDVGRFVASREPVIKKMQAALDIQVIKDSNFFCPADQGTLQESALTESDVGNGLVVWGTSYGKKQYYTMPNKSADINPNARMKWFEEAKLRFIKVWLDMIQRYI